MTAALEGVYPTERGGPQRNVAWSHPHVLPVKSSLFIVKPHLFENELPISHGEIIIFSWLIPVFNGEIHIFIGETHRKIPRRGRSLGPFGPVGPLASPCSSRRSPAKNGDGQPLGTFDGSCFLLWYLTNGEYMYRYSYTYCVYIYTCVCIHVHMTDGWIDRSIDT